MQDLSFDEVIRAIVILTALGAAIAMAFIFRDQFAVGAVVSAMAAGIGFLFPGKAITVTPAGNPTPTPAVNEEKPAQ